MFKKGYAFSIKHEGKHLREKKSQVEGKEQRQVFLPFDSEYSLFLKNKTQKRAKVAIMIDGKFIHPNHAFYIIDENSSLEIERFMIDGDLAKGESFKFVDVTHSEEEPGLISNGLVEIFIYPEKKLNFQIPVYSPPVWYYQQPVQPHYEPNPIFCTTSVDCGSQFSYTHPNSNIETENSLEGVTVGGQENFQEFQISEDSFEVEAPIILKLKILPQKFEKKNSQEECICCEGKGKQFNFDGIWVLCPACRGSGKTKK